MKKLILAIAASACAMSAYAANPDPMEFNVQLAGQVPVQDYFEVTPINWQSGTALEIKLPDDWGQKGNDQENRFSGHALQWKVKSSYGAVSLKFTSPQVDGSNDAVLKHKSAQHTLHAYPRLRGGSGLTTMKVGGAAIEVVPAKEAAAGKDVLTEIWVGHPETKPAVPGQYEGSMTAIFETEVAP